MVRVEGVSRWFGPKRILSEVSLEVHPGEVFGLLGPNGAGKTTLIRILSAVLSPNGGSAVVGDLNVATQAKRVKGLIGYATQEASVYRDLSVQENLEFRARLYLPTSQVSAAVQRTLERFSLQGFANTLAGALSGGWRQRLSLAQAVVHGPKVLFLDEPTTGLDPVSRRVIWDLIHEEAARGASVLVTTHYMDEAERCMRLALLYEGRVLAVGSPHELKQQAARQAHFGYVQSSLAQARALPGLLDAWPSGEGVRIIVSADSDLQNFEASQPSLEDVFIVLTKGETA